jgi:hypothetical protein
MSCCCAGDLLAVFISSPFSTNRETNRTNSRSQSIRNNNKKKQHKNQKWRGNLKNGFKWPTGHIIRSKWDSLYKQAFWDIENERKRFAHSSVREREGLVCVCTSRSYVQSGARSITTTSVYMYYVSVML